MWCLHHLCDIPDHQLLTHLFEHQQHTEEQLMTALSDIQTTLDTFGQQLTDVATTITANANTVGGELAGSIDTTKLSDGINAVNAAAATLASLVTPTT